MRCLIGSVGRDYGANPRDRKAIKPIIVCADVNLTTLLIMASHGIRQTLGRLAQAIWRYVFFGHQ
jgi:hypothetical protein